MTVPRAVNLPKLDTTITEPEWEWEQSFEDGQDAASPLQCIQTYDRKILKMKKHKRQKRKKAMYTILKWSGKL